MLTLLFAGHRKKIVFLALCDGLSHFLLAHHLALAKHLATYVMKPHLPLTTGRETCQGHCSSALYTLK